MSESEVCANIGPAERRRRNVTGVIGTVATMLVISALIETHAPPVWRFIVLLPAYVAAIGVLQARAQTCVAFARKGIRVLGDSRRDAEKGVDTAMTAKIAAQARKGYVQSTGAAGVATLV